MSGKTGIRAPPVREPTGPLLVSDARQSGQGALHDHAVLAIGIEPGNADYSAFPQLTPALVRDYIDAHCCACAISVTKSRVA